MSPCVITCKTILKINGGETVNSTWCLNSHRRPEVGEAAVALGLSGGPSCAGLRRGCEQRSRAGPRHVDRASGQSPPRGRRHEPLQEPGLGSPCSPRRFRGQPGQLRLPAPEGSPGHGAPPRRPTCAGRTATAWSPAPWLPRAQRGAVRAGRPQTAVTTPVPLRALRLLLHVGVDAASRQMFSLCFFL